MTQQVPAGTSLAFRHHAALVPPRADDVLLDASIGPSCEVVAVWVRPDDRDAVTGHSLAENGVGAPASTADRSVPAVVTVGEETVPVPELRHAHPMVQPLPGGAVVLAGTRAAWHPDTGPERNATVVGPDGDVLAEDSLGDGIAHLLTSVTGDIWVGYFDEGIYGNLGWGGPGPEPIGHPGLLRFDARLRRTWAHPFGSVSGARTGPIDECYGLNVADGAVHCLMITSPGFAVDDIVGDDVHGRISPGPASALCTDGARTALLSYGDDGLTVCVTEDTELRPTARHTVTLPDGSPLDGRRHAVVGRGPHLHVLTDDEWYRLDLDDVPGA